jgi:hypothetical protein
MNVLEPVDAEVPETAGRAARRPPTSRTTNSQVLNQIQVPRHGNGHHRALTADRSTRLRWRFVGLQLAEFVALHANVY